MRMTRRNPDGKTYRAPEVNVRVEKGRCYDTYFGDLVNLLGQYEDLGSVEELQKIKEQSNT